MNMEKRIDHICDLADHFWYPEIKKHMDNLLINPQPIINVNLETLYTKRGNRCADYVFVLVYKIFHQIKMTFSLKYRENFAHSVKRLMDSEEKAIKKVTCVKDRIFQSTIEDKNKAKKEEQKRIDIEKQRVAQAEKVIFKYIRNFIDYKNGLQELVNQEEVSIASEKEAIATINGYKKAHEVIETLSKKDKGLFSVFNRNKAEDRLLKEETVRNKGNFYQKIKENPSISKTFKKDLDSHSEDLPSLMRLFDNEIQKLQEVIIKREDRLNEAQNQLNELTVSKIEIPSLGPIDHLFIP